ncbi:MAG TPA: TetR/AcrR family transcriptional regulator [Kineosporiaceae bacterium]|nr:TetR/AcrR family transcriptional regulator [Kineosporiaceae bacterium]
MTVEGRRTANPRGQGGRLREELLAAALRLLEADPGVVFTLRGVAREAGVAAPSVYDHFPRLPDLVAAVRDQCAADLLAALERVSRRSVRKEPAERLRAVVRAYLRRGLEAPGLYAAAMAGPAGTMVVDLFADLLPGTVPGRATQAGRRAAALTLWTRLHGIVALRTAAPGTGWPALDRQLDTALAGLLRD